MREDVIDFKDSLVSFRAPAQQELKISESFSSYSAGDMSEAVGICKPDDECRMWKAYNRNVFKYCASAFKPVSSKYGHST